MNFEMRCRNESSVIGTIEMNGNEALLTIDYLRKNTSFKNNLYRIKWNRYKRGDVVKCQYCGGMIEVVGDVPIDKTIDGHSEAAEHARRINRNDGKHSIAGSEEHIINESDGSSMLVIGMTKVKLG
jgi:hypothetical protein